PTTWGPGGLSFPDPSTPRTSNADQRDAVPPPITSATDPTAISVMRRRPPSDRIHSVRREVEIPKQMHLRFETDARSLGDEVLDLTDERQDVRGGRTVRRHDEVRVLGRDRGQAVAASLRARLLDQAGGVVPPRALEHAPAVGLRERLRATPPLAGLVHPGPDLARVPGGGADGGH